MTNKEVFKIWAPAGKRWVDWVRPVPFIPITNRTKPHQPPEFILPNLLELELSDKSTAVIVDLPGAQSVEAGIVLAKYGYRPIPIFNGTSAQNGARSLVDNDAITSALVWGASILSDIALNDDAQPAFLTDSNRLQRFMPEISLFDNSWDVYHQDLPTEDYFLNNGISKILVISNKLSSDLKKVFAEHPKKQITIFWSDGYNEPKCVRKGRSF